MGAELFRISEGIRTYTEQRQDTDVEQQIDEALSRAVLIIFIGFGFHRQNLAMFVPKADSRQPSDVFCTVYKMDSGNHAAIQAHLSGAVRLKCHITLRDERALELLARLQPRIMMLVG